MNGRASAWAVAGGFLLLVGIVGWLNRTEVVAMAKSLLPRGLRLNNPGNLVKTPAGAQRWEGEVDSTDTRFAQFRTMADGVRAMGKLLMNYSRLYSLNTVRGIVNRYAPPTENNTSAYVNQVAAALGVSPDARIDVSARLPELVRAMGRVEQGPAFATVSDADLSAGIARARGIA